MRTICFHAVSPCAIPVQAAVRSLSGMVAFLNIVYNTVSNIIIIIENSCRWVLRRPRRTGGAHLPNRGHDGRKTSQTRDRADAQIPSDDDIACAGTGRSHHRQEHRGGHRTWATSAEGAPGRAGPLRPVPNPSRRREAGSVRARKKGPGGAYPKSRGAGSRINPSGGDG